MQMTGLHDKTGTRGPNGQRWSRGLALSILFHVLLFSLVLFVPESMPTRRISGSAVYEVNLVEMPSPRPAGPAHKTVKSSRNAVSSSREIPAARRIAPPVPEKRPVVIAKRVVERKKKPKKKAEKPVRPKVSPSRLIDGAIAKIEKKVKAEEGDHLKKALARVESRARTTDGGLSSARGGPADGITIRMYQLAVEEQIKSNWSYPVALMDPKKLKDLEAVVLVKVRYDGTILKSWLKRRSASSVFDGSVLKAVERSNPLPPFPEGYIRSQDEIEIRFNLSELEDF
ncbi:MAG: hypothetical protein B5M55_00710 [Desulfococcus sp. 4484_242]|nr:MAG: hypothetical protein B5M55_00710 [Desulfococcus sp. 4484_242]